MPAPSGFLSALGASFMGYGKDQQNRQDEDARQQQLQMQQAAAERAQQLQAAQIRNLDSEVATRGQRPDPAMTFDSDRGVLIDTRTGRVVTPQGLPEKPKAEPKEPSPHWVPAGQDPQTGQPLLLNNLTGETKVGGGIKPQSTAQGAAAGKAQGYSDLMEHSFPQMQALVGKVRPWAISGALKNPTLGNTILNSDEQQYLASFRDFLAGELHAESGARLSHEQLQFGMQRYAPTIGDSPETIAAKMKNAQSALEERRKQAQPQTPHVQVPGVLTPTKPKTGNIFLDGE